MTKSKAKWRAHRGVLELDSLLIPYIDQQFDNLSEQQRRLLFKLLDQSDPELQSLLIYSDNLDVTHQFYQIIMDIKKNNQLLSN